MNSVPVSAAVNECVNLCTCERLFSSKGFVNGLLRNVARQQQHLLTQLDEYHPAPQYSVSNPDGSTPVRLYSNKREYLSVKYSCPVNIVSLWINDYSPKLAEGILQATLGKPPLYVRVNTLKTTSDELVRLLRDEGVTAVPVAIPHGNGTPPNADGHTSDCPHSEQAVFPNALELKGVSSLAELDCYKNGLFHVQSVASQLACSVLAPKEGDTVSDVCAAPGGKSFTCAQLMNDKGRVYSYDLHEHRVKLIASGARRLGITCVSAKGRDALSDEPLEMSDRVLCDVPCSGLGTLSRKPELAQKDDLGLDTLPEIQYNILCNAARYVKAGGVLVYSTCTLHRGENGINADRFLREHEDFSPVRIDPPCGFERTIDEPMNQLTVFPQSVGDGFFIAAFSRNCE